MQNTALCLLAVAPRDRFAGRAAVCEEIFSTFGYTKPPSDPRLFGKWRHQSTYLSGEFSAVTVRYLILSPDGTCLSGGQLMAGMQHTDSAGNYTGDTHVDSGNGIDSRGRWRAAEKRIVLTWSDGSSESWEYFISGNSMLFKSNGSKKLWQRAN
jgi:hypothetical protein